MRFFLPFFMNITALYRIFQNHPLISTDSRKIEQGSLFFALKGENFNGNTFALNALEIGASYAVVDEEEYAVDERIILVKNVLRTLQELARHHRQSLGIPVLAITGTNGKTTTKELIASVLSRKYNLVYTRGNLNNHIGVPLTLLTLKSDTQMAVIEMGANHPGEIDALCHIALPDFGLITNVGSAHLEGFGSFEGVIQTKTELYRFLEKKDGAIFINLANNYLKERAGSVKKIGYSTVPDPAGLEGEVVSSNPFLILKVLFPKGWMYIKTRLVGSYNLENALAAAAVGQYFGIDPLEISMALEGYQPDNNRSQLVDKQHNRLLMDAYNANPSSTRAALENFAMLEAPKKAIILGDMLELGDVAPEEHQKIIDYLSTIKTDLVILTGAQYSGCHLPAEFLHFLSATALAEFLGKEQLSGYLILIKGSRGMKLESVNHLL
ncbi:MAG TPA: UDP-N-acetylmuramoyl-tripeptide--D-alanyl-D-alanine ligase [Prolixibacteraceae bacterium]